jgi:hypothetical protein
MAFKIIVVMVLLNFLGMQSVYASEGDIRPDSFEIDMKLNSIVWALTSGAELRDQDIDDLLQAFGTVRPDYTWQPNPAELRTLLEREDINDISQEEFDTLKDALPQVYGPDPDWALPLSVWEEELLKIVSDKENPKSCQQCAATFMAKLQEREAANPLAVRAALFEIFEKLGY